MYRIQVHMLIKDTHREKAPSNKTPASVYEKYKFEHLGSWYIKETLYKGFLNWKKILKKKKVVTGEIPLFVIGQFCLKVRFSKGGFISKCGVSNLSTFK